MSRIRNDRFLRLGAGLLACALLPLAAPPADATVIDWVTDVQAQNPAGGDSTIRVASNGATYTEVTDGRIDLRAKAYGLCKSPSRVARSTLYIDRLVAGGHWTLYSYHNTGLVHDIRSYERTENKVADLTAAERQAAVAACNKTLQVLVNQGKTVREVLSEYRVSYYANLFQARHYFGCDGELLNVDLETATAPLLTPVMCLKFDFPPPAGDLPRPGGLQQVFGVTAAELAVSPDHGSVTGHARLTVTGKLTANGNGQAKIRVAHNGTAGPVTTIAFPKAGTEEFSFPLNVPCPSGAGGGGNGIGGLAAAPPSSTVSGHLEYEIVAPAAGVRRSNKAFYSFTCKPTGTVTGGLPDLVVRLQHQANPPFAAVVRNAGSAPSAATQLEVRIGTDVQSLPVSALAVGQEVTIPFGPPGKGAQLDTAVQAHVDKPPAVQELNEGNNTASL